jgi:pimeloyl-ACP methyl ester carboxylesterase
MGSPVDTRKGLTALGILIVAALAAAGPPTASADTPCQTAEWGFTSPGKSVFEPVTVPSVVAGSPQASYDGVVAEPAVIPSGEKLPGVVLLHGRGGNLCGLWWAARLLASHGYITLAVSMDPGTDVDEASNIATIAARSSVSFLRGPDDDYRDQLKVDDIGMAGHSQGSMGVSRAQSHLPAVRAIVGLDNLRAFGHQDPGGTGCQPHGSLPVAPSVPGLGIGSETGCQDDAALTDKLAGFRAWRMASMPAMEAVLANSQHGWFAGSGSQSNSDHLSQLKATGYYMRAWFDLWLKHDHSAYHRLLSSTPMGRPIDDVLTAKSTPHHPAAFHSAAFLPGFHNYHCRNLRSCL